MVYNVGLGHGVNATTVEANGVIHNNTQDTAKFVKSHDFAGKIGNPPYPESIESGAECQFKHVGTGGRSAAAIVYRAKNGASIRLEILLAWSKDSGPSNKAYTEIKDDENEWDWDHIANKLKNSSDTSEYAHNGCVSKVKLSGDVFDATLSLDSISAA